ncbi:MAG: sugar O-acetyltransferase [Planctomycetaceae bacterium]|nr:sugar O-acetyltransferase [Planctomycetaceae bacterium]
MDVFQRDQSGERISLTDPDYHKISGVIHEAQQIVAELNTGYHENDEVQRIFSRLTGVTVDESFWLMPPFYTDFGRNIRIGKNVFINTCCTFMDRGGITIEDRVLIAPKVNLVTTGHPIDPVTRRDTISRPIVIKENAWLGIGVSVMPGVTIGENSIITAHAVVTKDIPANVIAGGIPAKVIRTIDPMESRRLRREEIPAAD